MSTCRISVFCSGVRSPEFGRSVENSLRDERKVQIFVSSTSFWWKIQSWSGAVDSDRKIRGTLRIISELKVIKFVRDERTHGVKGFSTGTVVGNHGASSELQALNSRLQPALRTVLWAISMRHPTKRKAGVGPAAATEVRVMDNTGEQQQRQFWVLKTEPDEWSWQNQKENEGLSVWDGVRNAQAQKLMKSMSVDDLCLFYHTGKLREVAGIVRVVKTFYPDPTDDSGKWGAVDVKEVEAFKQPVTLAQMKDDEHFRGFLMLRQPRLSVVPVEESIWRRLCELGGAEWEESLAVKEAAPTAGAPVKKTKKKAEVKGGGSGKSENGLPIETATASSTRRSRRSTSEAQAVETTANGRTDEEPIVKAGTRARKRGSSQEEVIDEPKKKVPKKGTEKIVETPSGSRTTPKTRRKKAS